MTNRLNYIEQLFDDGFNLSTVTVAKLGRVGEYVYLWNKLLYPVVLIASVNLLVRDILLCYG